MKELKPWEVVLFSWGTAIRHSKGRWERLFLFPDAQEIDVSNLNVTLHDNGIKILGVRT